MEMNRHIQRNFEYRRREEPGTQEPAYTLSCGSGQLSGFRAALYGGGAFFGHRGPVRDRLSVRPAVDGGAATVEGAGATHAWASVYLPGAGWVDFDPTNGLPAART